MSISNDDFSALARRIQLLEDIEAIRRLKARYLNACDQKNPDDVRACFTDGDLIVDTAHLGVFKNADSFVEMYRNAACHDFVLDKHQAGNAEIDIIDGTHARGLWCLDYRCLNTKDRTLTLMSVLYHDTYEKLGNAWKISGSRTEFKTALHCTYSNGTLEALVAGHSIADAPVERRYAA